MTVLEAQAKYYLAKAQYYLKQADYYEAKTKKQNRLYELAELEFQKQLKKAEEQEKEEKEEENYIEVDGNNDEAVEKFLDELCENTSIDRNKIKGFTVVRLNKKST